ncbi:MAG TPA: hypothetical protein PLQ57_16830 [Saprospiraceae bacterium]|nr:hypothetical protein [Saprospiraceae bacterium]HRG22707.1 hypothetical protein [Saprospiraceae bacterium]
MATMLYQFAIIFGLIGLGILMLNIRYIFTGKEFHGSCASNNPLIKNKFGECTVCGKKPEEECKMPQVHK